MDIIELNDLNDEILQEFWTDLILQVIKSEHLEEDFLYFLNENYER